MQAKQSVAAPANGLMSTDLHRRFVPEHGERGLHLCNTFVGVSVSDSRKVTEVQKLVHEASP